MFRKIASLILLLALVTQANPAWGQSLLKQGTEPEIVTEGYQFTEGPLWHPDGYLIFSDIPANTIYKWHPDSTATSVFLKPSGHSNGLAMAEDGRIIISQHDGRIAAFDGDSVAVLAARYNGKRLNSPNDLAIKSDGTIYFTDPPYGVTEAEKEQEVNGVYRIAKDGSVELLYDELSRPNGIAFSPDEHTLYVNDSATGRILAFDVTTDGSLSLPSEFATVGASDSTGAADGMTVDEQGRLYSTGPGGIYVFSPDGEQIDKIAMPAQSTNLAWGREGEKELFVTTPAAIYRVQLRSQTDSNKDEL